MCSAVFWSRAVSVFRYLCCQCVQLCSGLRAINVFSYIHDVNVSNSDLVLCCECVQLCSGPVLPMCSSLCCQCVQLCSGLRAINVFSCIHDVNVSSSDLILCCECVQLRPFCECVPLCFTCCGRVPLCSRPVRSVCSGMFWSLCCVCIQLCSRCCGCVQLCSGSVL